MANEGIHAGSISPYRPLKFVISLSNAPQEGRSIATINFTRQSLWRVYPPMFVAGLPAIGWDK